MQNLENGSPGTLARGIVERAERRWATVVCAIVALMIGVMIFTSVHWATMPPSRVEAIDPATLHLSGEFMESNLGSSLQPDGRVIVHVLAQQYSFVPACLTVPAGIPVTFRATSADVVHGFDVAQTNVNAMLVPGFVSTFTTTFNQPGVYNTPCHEYCSVGHASMWAELRVLPTSEFLQRARAARRVDCVHR